jgi:hypothetical protein
MTDMSWTGSAEWKTTDGSARHRNGVPLDAGEGTDGGEESGLKLCEN